MTRGPRCTPRTQAALGLALCALLAWPALRTRWKPACGATWCCSFHC
jgi:hypothetical protein